MNKYQLVLNDVTFRLYLRENLKEEHYQGDASLVKLQELVDKAIPKKPKVISKPYGHLIFEEYRCPVCNAQMGRNNCCSNNDCRQAIDWSKE